MDSGMIEFKGMKDSILIRIRIGDDPETLLKRLSARLSGSRSFFSGTAIGLQIVDDISIDMLDAVRKVISESGLILDRLVPTAGPDTGKENVTHRESITDTDIQNNASSCIFIKRTLRSGQRVESPGDVVLMGDVNPGAEIVAGGDIVVMGNLRGLAHAGAGGDKGSMVVAFRLSPTQLRIADLISRSPDATVDAPTAPEVARIQDDRIVIETLSISTTGR